MKPDKNNMLKAEWTFEILPDLVLVHGLCLANSLDQKETRCLCNGHCKMKKEELATIIYDCCNEDIRDNISNITVKVMAKIGCILSDEYINKMKESLRQYRNHGQGLEKTSEEILLLIPGMDCDEQLDLFNLFPR